MGEGEREGEDESEDESDGRGEVGGGLEQRTGRLWCY